MPKPTTGIRPGAAIAYHRKLPKPGKPLLTQAQAAARLGVSASLWQKWESGDRLPDMAQWIRIARLLQVRQLDELIGAPGTVALPEVAPAPGGPVPAIRDALLGLLPAEPVQVSVLATGVEALWSYWQGSQPGRYAMIAARLPARIAQAEATIGALESSPDPAGKRAALRSASALYRLTWAFARAHDGHRWGLIAADRARLAAEAADDAESLTAATWGNAAMLSSVQETEASYALLRRDIAALEPQLARLDRLHAGVLGQMHLLGAIQAARLGRAGDAEALLEDAGRIAGRTGETNAHHTAFGPWNVIAHAAAVASERGRYRQAVDIGEQLDPGGCPVTERRVAYRVQMAHAYERAGERASAVTMLARAVSDSAEETASLVLARETALVLARKVKASYAAELGGVLTALGLAA